MSRNAAEKGRLILLAGCASAALAGAAALRADLMVSHGFSLAFGTQTGNAPFEVSAFGDRRQQAGDEGYWLTRADVASPTPFDKPLAIGDRIAISNRDGGERRLEVVDLKAIGVPLFAVAAGTPPLRLLLVTCRALDGTEHGGRPLLRFIIESEAPEPAAPPQPAAKTL